MHNLYANFVRILEICKSFSTGLVNDNGNVPRRGPVPRFSDLEVVALGLTAEAMGIDSESLLFSKIEEYRGLMPNIVSRRQFNDRRKSTRHLCESIRKRVVMRLDGGEDTFIVDSKPLKVCQLARGKRCKMYGMRHADSPDFGYCASQAMHYFGYKLHAVCGVSGTIHSYDLTPASVHDIKYMNAVGQDYSNCTVIGDRGYISAQVQLDLFETANIRLEVPYRHNQKHFKPLFKLYAKVRKRIETDFSQLDDQFNIMRNYAKQTHGFLTRIIGKVAAFTILQYINKANGRPIGKVKYALG